MGNKNVENSTTVRPYARVNAGVQNFDGTARPIATTEIGARLTKGNLRAEAGAQIGTDLGAQANVNYRLSTSKNGKFGVDLQANASYSHPFTGGKTYSYEVTGSDYAVAMSTGFRPDKYKAAAGVNFNYAPNERLTLNAGFEAGAWGYVGNKTVSVSPHDTNPSINASMVLKGNSEPYISPTFGADYKVNNNFSVGMHADFNEATAKITYVF